MYILHFAASRSLHHPHRPLPTTTTTSLFTLSPRRFFVRASLPFLEQNAKYHKELQAAVDVVERACRLCVDIKKYGYVDECKVKKSLFSSEGRILEKNDQTPVTIADFGVQALVSLELGSLFPSIPLVAEEDSAFLRLNNLASSVLDVVTDKAIDRGGNDAFVFGPNPATYWVLDPIDGTRGFLKGSEALYVNSRSFEVGLSLVVEGEIVFGVMGYPNWQEADSSKPTIQILEYQNFNSGSGVIMVAHVGCGTWKKRLSDMPSNTDKMPDSWIRCFVDEYNVIKEARFCISDSQSWESLPLSSLFDVTTDDQNVLDKEILLLPQCCGSLCKYFMVASGRASVFILQSRAQRIIKVWDHAVGIICVQEAGGKVTDWRGSQIDLAADQDERRILLPTGGILVTNGSLHDQMLGMISSTSSVV